MKKLLTTVLDRLSDWRFALKLRAIERRAARDPWSDDSLRRAVVADSYSYLERAGDRHTVMATDECGESDWWWFNNPGA